MQPTSLPVRGKAINRVTWAKGLGRRVSYRAHHQAMALHKERASRLQSSIPVVVGDMAIQTDGYVDTGADVSMIDKRYLGSHPELLRYQSTTNTTTLDGIGGKKQTEEKLDVAVYVGDDAATIELFIANLPAGLSLILGRDWLSACGAVIDTRKNEVRLFSSTIHCELRPKPEPDASAELIGSVRIAGRRHVELPAKLQVDKQYVGRRALVFPTVVTRCGTICPAYVADVDKDGRLPLVLSNVWSRRARLRPLDVHCDVEFDSTFITAVTQTEGSTAAGATPKPQTSGETMDQSSATATEGTPTIPSSMRTSMAKKIEMIDALDLAHLDISEQAKLRDLLRNHVEAISDGVTTGKTSLLHHSIDTGGERPVAKRPYRRPPGQNEIIEKEVKTLMDQGLVYSGFSPWAAPVVLVKKKDGAMRFCIDYRGLNAVTKRAAYLMPRVDDILDSLNGRQWFTGLDLKSGYWQVALDEDAQRKSAFATRSGQYMWKVMPFGLVNAPATFQHLMDVVLAGLTPELALVYVDDVIIFTKGDFNDHLLAVDRVLGALQKAGLQLALNKCQFGCQRLVYLGHIVSKEGIATDPAKVATILKLAAPTSLGELRRFLGSLGYYRRFISQFAAKARPLTSLLRNDQPWVWESDQQAAYESLRQALVSAPILHYPDWTKPFVIETDASMYALSGVLSQRDEASGKLLPVVYWSRLLRPHETRTAQPELEVLAVINATEEFQPYVWGKHFTICTDAQALTWLKTAEGSRSKLARWALRLQAYDYEVVHRPGASNATADMLSRNLRVKEADAEGPASSKVGEEAVLSDQPTQVVARSKVGETMNETTPGKVGEALHNRTLRPRKATVMPTLVRYRQALERAKVGTPDDLAKLQRMDSFGGRMIQAISNLPVSGNEDEKRETKQWQDAFVLRDGLLFFVGSNAAGRPQVFKRRPAIYIPQGPARVKLLEGYHNMGHRGEWRLYHSLRDKYFWPRMADDTRRFVRACEQCQKYKRVKRVERLGSMSAPTPGHTLAIDFFGPLGGLLATTKRGNRYALLMVDIYSQYLVTVPVKDKEAATVCKKLRTHWLRHYTCPRRLLSDNDMSFTGGVSRELYHTWRIKKVTITPWNPQGNGSAERHVQVVKEALTRLSDRKPDDWDDYLYVVDLQFNSEISHKTGYSPFFLFHGRSPVLPPDLGALPNDEALTYVGHAAQLIEGQREARRLVDETIAEHRDKQQLEQILHGKRLPKFQVGEQVWLRVGDQANLGVWDQRWRGPFTVKEACAPTYCRLDGLPTGDKDRVHVQRLAHFWERDQRLTEVKPLLQDEDTEDQGDIDKALTRLDQEPQGDVYEVERILDERTQPDGRASFLVKWKGYPLADATWEPRSNLTHSTEALAEWHATSHPASRLAKRPRPPTGVAPKAPVRRRRLAVVRSEQVGENVIRSGSMCQGHKADTLCHVNSAEGTMEETHAGRRGTLGRQVAGQSEMERHDQLQGRGK